MSPANSITHRQTLYEPLTHIFRWPTEGPLPYYASSLPPSPPASISVRANW